MKLYLVRHGNPVPEEANPEKPLSEEGIQQCEKVGEVLANSEITVENVFHSGKERAEQTAEILAKHVGGKIEQQEGLKPNDDVAMWAEKADSAGQDLMLVGHLPFMAKLSGLLLCGNAENQLTLFQEATCSCLEKNDEGKWIVLFVVSPELV